MKKLHITIALLLWSIAQVAEAQNMYRNYRSFWVPNPESTVSVVHSNGFVYYFQTWNGILSVTELDPVQLSPTTGNGTAFNMNYSWNQIAQNFYLQGAFEDFDGNFVLYGYQDNINSLKEAVMLVIDPLLQTLNYYYLPLSLGTFIEGCAGYNSYGDKIYVFILNDELYVTDAINPSALIPPSQINFHKYGFSAIAKYTDISWDNTCGKFIATGSYCSSATQWSGPFVDMVTVNTNNLSHFRYCLDNQILYDISEEKALHVKIDDDHLLVYHDLRKTDIDIIWLTLVRHYSNSNHAVIDSRFYYLPCAKNFALDLIYDDVNNRFNFLGNLNSCSMTPYLAQGNPFSLSSGIEVGMLDGGLSFDTCHPYVTTDTFLLKTNLQVNKMSFNYQSPCGNVMISGFDTSINAGGSILTETLDIAQSSCDQPLTVKSDFIPTQIVNFYPLDADTLITALPDQQIAISDNVVEYLICDDPEACSYQYRSPALRKSPANSVMTSFSVNVDRTGFVCDGFTGTIHYSLYDMEGRIVAQGDTRNAAYNTFPTRNGVFLLRATDETGNSKVTKVFLCN